MHDVVNLTCKFAILLDIEKSKFQAVGKAVDFKQMRNMLF